jgi:hypothetical protein
MKRNENMQLITNIKTAATKRLSWKPQAITSKNLTSELVAYMGEENRTQAFELAGTAKARIPNGATHD